MNEKAARLYRKAARIAALSADPVDQPEAYRQKYAEMCRADVETVDPKERAKFRGAARHYVKRANA